MCVRACTVSSACVCQCVCVCVCARACVRACVHVCGFVFTHFLNSSWQSFWLDHDTSRRTMFPRSPALIFPCSHSHVTRGLTSLPAMTSLLEFLERKKEKKEKRERDKKRKLLKTMRYLTYSVCSNINFVRYTNGSQPFVELCFEAGDELMLNVLRCHFDILGTSCDQCRSTVQ